jgi:hypothetical protein
LEAKTSQLMIFIIILLIDRSLDVHSIGCFDVHLAVKVKRGMALVDVLQVERGMALVDVLQVERGMALVDVLQVERGMAVVKLFGLILYVHGVVLLVGGQHYLLRRGFL